MQPEGSKAALPDPAAGAAARLTEPWAAAGQTWVWRRRTHGRATQRMHRFAVAVGTYVGSCMYPMMSLATVPTTTTVLAVQTPAHHALLLLLVVLLLQLRPRVVAGGHQVGGRLAAPRQDGIVEGPERGEGAQQ